MNKPATTLPVFQFSVVGQQDDNLVNVYGHVAAQCEEYARRQAVQYFKRAFPGAWIHLVGASVVPQMTMAVKQQP